MDILEVLQEKGITYKKSNNPQEIIIQCTSGAHFDKNPSLHYNLYKNLFHCWSCGFSGGGHKFLSSIGIITRLPIESKQPYRIELLKQTLEERKKRNNIEIPKDAINVTGIFKNISTETLIDFGVFITKQHSLQDYICIPIYQFGRLKFLESRLRFDSDFRNKYQRWPKGAKADEIMFPIDKLKTKNTVILVEGVFDMLNLWQHGYHNTLSIFGTNNFGKKKLDLLDKLGITKVYLILDGDEPGQKATTRIAELLESHFIQTQIIKLPIDKDPGNLSIAEIEVYLKGINSEQ